MKISIIGAGHVGGEIANRLAFQKLADNIVLVDIDKNISLAKAEDISHAINVYRLNCRIVGSDDFTILKDSDIVVITAGSARKSGMTRDDLTKTNQKVIRRVTEEIVKFTPGSIIIVVTNPVDIMTYLVCKYSNFDRFKVIGMAGVLDTGRLSHIINKRIPKLTPADIESLVIGPHGNSMLCVPNSIKLKGKKITEQFSDDELKKIFEKVSTAGSELVSLYKGNSAFFGPSAAVTKMIKCILENNSKIVSCSILLKGEYGVEDVCLGIPVVLGTKGIKEIVKISLTETEKTKFLNIAKSLQGKIQKLEGV